jgi:predicted KAP-like P-loop ATPase
MWSDNESISDYIDFSHLRKAVTNIIDKDNLLPCSIGLYGDWGSGKSSLMRMIETHYDQQEDILVVKFNGWLFEGYEDAKTVLMGRIVDDIISKRTFTDKALKYGAKLLKRIDWIKLAGSSAKYGLSFLSMGPIGLAGVAITDVVSKLGEIDYEKYIKERKSEDDKDPDDSLRGNIQDFHRNFEGLINETKLKKLIVFIDDLDRCSPDTIIGTLEAIKLFLFTRKTAFVIGADERLIKYAVKRRFPEVPGENMEVGRDYLEKLIQYPIRIPPLSNIELTTYINLLFSQLYCEVSDFETVRNNVILAKQSQGFNFVFDQNNYKTFFDTTSVDHDDAITLCSQIVPILSIGLNGNPRQTKRFLNTMLIRIDMAQAKGISLKRKILAKLMLLEYFKPETFTYFHDIQATNNGTLPIVASLEKMAVAPENSETENSDIKTSSEFKTLTDDSWIMDWIKSTPQLGNENLQAYFYFARDKLTTTSVNLQRMTPKAQEVIQKLLSDSQSFRTTAPAAITTLSSSEAASIFEALVQKIRQEERSSSDSRAFSGLFEIVRVKRDLKSQLITFLTNFPENNLPLSVATLTESILKDSDQQALTALFTKWSTSPNKKLASVVKKKLK